MPKLKFSLPGDERYNTLLSVVALLQRVGEMHIEDLADHFGLSKKTMRGMLSTLNTTSFMPRNSEEQLPFYVDLDRIDDEDGVVCLEFDNAPQGLPQITKQQSAALLAGLSYLQTIPEFENSEDVDILIGLIGAGQSNLSPIAIVPGHFDSDLAVLKRAILADKRIRCRYVNGKGQESEREIDPLILVSSEDHWYLRGFCLTHNEVRTFRLDHMVDATILDQHRSQEAKDASTSLDESAPIYQAGVGDTEVVVELAPEAYSLAGFYSQLKEPVNVGSENILVSLKVGYLPDLGPMVCRFGGHAKVISPKEARDVVRAYAESALAANLLELESE